MKTSAAPASSSGSVRSEAAVLRKIRRYTRAPAFCKEVERLLIELCRIDTTPNAEVEKMRAAEAACFQVIERELSEAGGPGKLERRSVNPLIKNHPSFSLLHFTKTPDRPRGLTPEAAYAGRSNLVYLWPGSSSRPGTSVALNAHVDVVAPYFPPHASKGVVHGRGACDDKGPVVAVVAAIKVLARLLADEGRPLNRNLLGMFVVEEETGGNGSLSLAMDRELRKLYNSIVVCECTGLKVHPANRGAVWYRALLQPPEGSSALEMAASVIEQLEKEGAALRAESAHPLFPQRPVQTCHGIIGPFGEHPSRICGEVIFRILTGGTPGKALETLVVDCLKSGLAVYTGLYGDKTLVTDVATGKPMVRRHFDLRRTDSGFEVKVHGATGHMGAIRDRDGAITKMAHLVQSLVRSKPRLEALAGGHIRLELAPGTSTGAKLAASAAGRRESALVGVRGPLPAKPPAPLALEGGQGFVPTHSIDEIMQRLREAAHSGARNYLTRIGRTERADEVVTVTYEKLHNDAFDGDPKSPSMRNAIAVAKTCGLKEQEPVLGWTVSCDARLFASEYPGLPVLTFGPGQLAFAHSDHEQIALEEIRSAAEFLALFVLRQTGTL